MDTSRNDLLGEIAADAALERSDFLVQATEQLLRFLEANKARIAELGGLTLIDEDPDYLADRPRPHVPQPHAGSSTSSAGSGSAETEVIESAGELVELYNPADIYAGVCGGSARGRPGSARSRPRRPICSRRPGSVSTRRSRPARIPTPRRPTTGPRRSRSRSTRRTTKLRRSASTTSRWSSRSAASAAKSRLLEQFEDAAGAAERPDRRPDHQRRR